jgi:hypothetical protein
MDDEQQGAPTDFGGRVIPNPTGVKPVLDTEIQPNVAPLAGGAKMSTGMYHPPRLSLERGPQEGVPNINSAQVGDIPGMEPTPALKPYDPKTSPTESLMRHYKVPMTRENYLILSGFEGDPTAEQEQQIPARFRRPDEDPKVIPNPENAGSKKPARAKPDWEILRHIAKK